MFRRISLFLLLVVSVLFAPRLYGQVSASGVVAMPPYFAGRPAWAQSEMLRWAYSDAGKRALHYSSHAAAKGLLKLVGENPTIIVPPPSADAFVPSSPDFGVSPCTPNGTKFDQEPPNGDPMVNWFGGVQPVDKFAPSVDFLPGAGTNGGDLVLVGATDERGLLGALGNSASVVVWHNVDKMAGTPDCLPTNEAATPDVVDINGVIVSGFGGMKVAADATRKRFVAVDAHFGTAPDGFPESGLGFFFTTPAVLASPACAAAAEGKAKNAACWKGTVLAASEYNPITLGNLCTGS